MLRFNKKIYKYLKNKGVTPEQMQEMLQAGAFHARQNATSQAARLGQEKQEAAVNASIFIAEIIKQKYRQPDFKIRKVEYCYAE